MKIGKCKLCLSDNIELLSESHIIPRFFHYGLKDDKKKYNLMMPDKFIEGKRQHWQNPSGAMYEGNLLCKNCDNVIIGSLETNLSKILIENEENYNKEDFYTDDKNIEFKIYKNIDYKKFKLGLLSILWRTSISNLEFFKEVNLTLVNSENIRLMLLNNEAKNIEDYPIISYLLNKVDEKNLIINPRYLNENGNEYCKLIINGYVFLFIIRKLESSEKSILLQYIPNHSGLIHMQIKEEKYMKKYVQDIIIATKMKLNEKLK
ncbi:hypothetical protein ACM55K_07140 [Flavobacterium sp. LT1R49]|uniref:hypothetical protein n=1 Tax=Flavobacterium arabinosi TaxID=3398737 RepID=UPI003A85C0DE